jgi:L-lysine 2,3-aminomutase
LIKTTFSARPTGRIWRQHQMEDIPQLAWMRPDQRLAMRAVAAVLPFAVSDYVLDELVDWGNIPDDPIFQLVFPQPEMLEPAAFQRLFALFHEDAPRAEIDAVAREIQLSMNPHPAGQKALNVPVFRGERLEGVQHKYFDTALFFPARGQTCLSYCTYCFRWPQFVGLDDQKFAASESETLREYLLEHRRVENVLFTGGDPLVMRARLLERYVEPLLRPGLEHVSSLRFGTKALAFDPHRFLDRPDSDELLRLFERIVASGKHLAVMAHYTHPRELETEAARKALRRVIATGAVVRCQAPLVRHINDEATVWARMWTEQVKLGAVPYYMFVERDTGPRAWFEVPLGRANDIFRQAVSSVCGLARTVRGPSMSATPGKVVIDGVTSIGSERVFALRFLRARDTSWVGRPFFARYDPDATWLDQLRPAFGEREFFFEPGLRRMVEAQRVREGYRERSSMLPACEAAPAEEGSAPPFAGTRAGTEFE